MKMKKFKDIIAVFVSIGILLAILITVLLRLKLPVWVTAFSIAVLVLAAVYVIFSRYSGRINALSNSIKVIHSGNLDYSVETYSKDGLGKLSREFSKVAEDLKRTSKELAEARITVAEQEDRINELKAREEHFRKLFEQSNDAVFVYDLDGNIINVNNKAVEMTGYPEERLQRASFIDLYTEEEKRRARPASRPSGETGAIRYEAKFKRANGQEIDVEISTSLVDLKKGQMQSIVSDITSRKRMQLNLRESEKKFRTFMETASDLMFMTDEEGNISYANQAMANTLGYLKEELLKQNIKDVLAEETLREYDKMREELLKEGQIQYEPVWETKNRIKIYGEMKEVAIYEDGRQFKGSRGIFRDISERKKIEEAQRLANLGKLAADVAHEVNNPITIILARAEMLKMQRKQDKDLKEKMGIIIGQCEAARTITNRLLKFSRPSRGALLEKDVNELIDSVIALVEHQFLGDEVQIGKNLGEKIPAIKADEKQIQEVFMNLLRNADEAMPQGGTINVSTYVGGDGKVIVDVRDTGPGISEEVKEKMFDPFFTTKEKGTGLGISVCYGILKAHGATLEYVSPEEEQGTIARVTFPPAGGSV
jgi:PAS domain S-box-containing protein